MSKPRLSKRVAYILLLAICAPASADTVFFDNFSDGNAADGMPVTWDPLAGFPGTFDASSGDFVLTPSNRAIVATVPALVLGDVSIRSQVRVLDQPTSGGGVELIARGNITAVTGYLAGLNNQGVLYIRQTGVTDPLARAETDLRLFDEDIVMQFDAFGSSLSLWAWPADESMPAAPLLTATNISYPQGVIGIDYFATEAVPSLGSGIFRYVHVADTPIVDPVLLLGDTDDDGIPGEYPDDFEPIRANFRKNVTMRSEGDLVPNGVVDFSDFKEWKTAFLAGGGSLADIDLSFTANVPEPTTFLLATLAACAPARFRRSIVLH